VVGYQLKEKDGIRVSALIPIEDRGDVHRGAEAWATWAPEWGYVLPAEPGADAAA